MSNQPDPPPLFIKAPQPEANFETLLQLCQMTKAEFARIMHMHHSTISTWGCAAPTYAVRYLQLLLDKRQAEGELRKARDVIGEYANLRASIRDFKKKCVSLMEELEDHWKGM